MANIKRTVKKGSALYAISVAYQNEDAILAAYRNEEISKLDGKRLWCKAPWRKILHGDAYNMVVASQGYMSAFDRYSSRRSKMSNLYRLIDRNPSDTPEVTAEEYKLFATHYIEA